MRWRKSCRGGTIHLIVGTGAGGGFDTYSRTIARHMSKYIPGNPVVIVDNLPGAGFLRSVQHLYKVAKPDGLTFGNWIGTLVMAQLIGRKAVDFDARKFEYIGSPVQNHGAKMTIEFSCELQRRNFRA